uniref:Prolyl endopeptidase n=1 Tax=Parastrongyloides trichosuri TaxID=131310 RepID=A0A0N4ZJP2_PARTI
MGTQQEEDIIISDYPSDKNFRIYGYSSKDGRYLFLNLYNKSNKNHTVYYYDLYNLKGEITQKLDWKPLFDKDDAFYYIFHVDNDELYIRTNKNASMEKIFKMKFSDALKGEDSWNILVDENKNRTILSIFVVGKKYLIMDCLENVKNVFYIHDKSTGEVLQKISLEPVYTYYTFGSSESNEFFISFSNRITPGTTYRGNLDDLDKGEKVKLEIIRQKKIKNVDLNKFVLNQIFYPSKDGTNISMFLYHKKNLKLNSNNPVLLEAYGGFSLSQLPVYATYATLFVKNFNGIVCTVNVRGGGEYGERWHQDGMLHKKHNVFDDFIAGTEYLIEKNYTNPSKIAIAGASNGGLLMAVVSQRRPDLFGAVIIKYSVLDMLRFHKFNLGSGWISEYGDPDKKEDFDYLMTYSPLHNLKLPPRPVQWPSILLKTGDHDDRVDPSHTLKYVARLYEILQSAKEYQTNPILAIVTKSSGHGIIKPLSKAIADMVDVFCFMEISLNITWIE